VGFSFINIIIGRNIKIKDTTFFFFFASVKKFEYIPMRFLFSSCVRICFVSKHMVWFVMLIIL
jgi:hypothetical protein